MSPESLLEIAGDAVRTDAGCQPTIGRGVVLEESIESILSLRVAVTERDSPVRVPIYVRNTPAVAIDCDFL